MTEIETTQLLENQDIKRQSINRFINTSNIFILERQN